VPTKLIIEKMQQIVSQPTLASPRKTGGLVLGVSALIVGVALVVKYLVNRSRKPIDAEVKRWDGTMIEPQANWDFNLNPSTPPGNEPIGPELPEEYRIAERVGCGNYYKFLVDVDEMNPDNNQRKCGKGVYEFQEMLYEFGHLSDINDVDGMYGAKTKEAHQKWLAASE
jgi:hypothetical protein